MADQHLKLTAEHKAQLTLGGVVFGYILASIKLLELRTMVVHSAIVIAVGGVAAFVAHRARQAELQRAEVERAELERAERERVELQREAEAKQRLAADLGAGGTPPRHPFANDDLSRSTAADLIQSAEEIRKLAEAISGLYEAATFLSVTLQTKGSEALRLVNETAQRLQDDAKLLGNSFDPIAAPRTQLPQTAEPDPDVLKSVRRFLTPLIANADYRAEVVALVADRVLVEDIQEQLLALTQLSSNLYTHSRLRRGESSPRMREWAKDNANGEEALDSFGPLLRRLRQSNELDSSEAESRFVRGLHRRELQVMNSVLAQKADAISNEQQRKPIMRNAREALAKQWLTPAIRLYQLIFEALPIEDREVEPMALSRQQYDVQRSQRGLRPARDAFRDAAAALGYNYVHHELYVIDPRTTKFDLSQGTPRRQFAEWIEGELGREGLPLPVISSEVLGRVTMPRFESDERRHTLEGKLMIIVGGA